MRENKVNSALLNRLNWFVAKDLSSDSGKVFAPTKKVHNNAMQNAKIKNPAATDLLRNTLLSLLYLKIKTNTTTIKINRSEIIYFEKRVNLSDKISVLGFMLGLSGRVTTTIRYNIEKSPTKDITMNDVPKYFEMYPPGSLL